MCGIVGAFFQKGVGSFPIRRMADEVKHRGPDDEGYLLVDAEHDSFGERAGRDTDPGLRLPSIEEDWPAGSRLVLGHRRLSILDLSIAGHQPMADSEKKIWITYNGEIYNYLELRRELEERGVRFRSKTDTEVIIESYKRWGEACLDRFNGMWAFALWDARQKVLFCARDRFGVKPFYYAEKGQDFFFASEIKALLLVPELPKRFSEEAIFDYLALSLSQWNSQTFFAGIRSLEPGHSLTVDLKGQVRLKRWYSFPEKIGMNPYCREDVVDFRNRLEDAVRLRLQSDVTVGSCLSGGLDSSSVVCLAAKRRSAPLETFSACFEDGRYDERKFIEPVILKTGAQAHFVFPKGEGLWHEWPELIRAQEEPFGSTSLYAHWCVMREARRYKVPVLLNGQGGDELLGGYPRYSLNRTVGLMLQGNVDAFLNALKDPRVFGILAFNLLPSFLQVPLGRLAAGFKPFLRKEFVQKYSERNTAYLIDRAPRQKNLGDSLQSDFLTYVLPVLLRYEDKNSMRFSIEVRLPLLDYRLVEWVFGLEDAAKIEKGINKRILRESMHGILPEEVRLRTDKMGWATPENEWLQRGRAVVLDFFKEPSRSAVAPWIEVDQVRNLIEQNRWKDSLWRVINLEMWLRTFFSQPFRAWEASSYPEAALST